MPRKKGEGKVIIRKSGKSKDNQKKYGALWVYVPSKLSKDSSFPFLDKEEVQIELVDGKLIISKKDEFLEITEKFGYENATLPRLIEKKAIENKNRPFLYFKDEIYSYKELNEETNKIAHGIIKLCKELKIKRPIIAQMLPNCPEYIFTWFGASKAQGVLVHLNREMNEEVIKYILNNSETKILIIDYHYLNKSKDFYEDLPKLEAIIVFNAPKDYIFNDKYIDFQEIISSERINPVEKEKKEEKLKIRKGFHTLNPMEILYSSGTTGKPKGIKYQHYKILGSLIFAKELQNLGLNESERIYCPLPLYNGIFKMLVLFPAIFSNASIVLADKFHASTFWDDIQKYNITIISYFGRMLSILMNQPQTKSEREHSVKWGFGVVTPKENWEVFENRFGFPLYETWAVTEGSGITINKEGSKGGKIGSIGKPILGFEIKIVDDKGNELPPGNNNIGEMISRNRDPGSMGSWIHTEDYGYKDKDGFIYYIGKKSDIFKRGNRFNSTLDIEKIANIHPFIIESSVFSVARTLKTEKKKMKENKEEEEEEEEDIKICVVLKNEKTLSHNELDLYFHENLAYYMVPRYIEIKKTLSKYETDRINKSILKKEWDNPNIKIKTWDSKIKNFIQQQHKEPIN
ncbi:MAG: ATP-dependent acyl-CoA ligase [archaeon]|nr:ATP-dependent acyl-CoA ligase [archaeon]